MSTTPPGSAPAPTSPPSTNTTSPPPSTTSPPPSSSPPPPSTTSPPPSSSSSPPPPDAPPPSSPSPPTTAPPPATPSSPSPPATPSSPPPPSPPSNPGTPPSPPSGSPPVTRTPPPPVSSRSPPPPANSESSGSKGSSVSSGMVAGIAIGGVLIVVLICFVWICCRKKKRREYGHGPPPDGPYGGQQQQWQNNAPPPTDHVISMAPKPSQPPQFVSPQPPPPQPFNNSSGGSASSYSGGSSNPLAAPSPGMSLGFSQSTFTYDELAMASNGFSDANLLGQGGFGYVHKGVLPNGKQVAIKRLKVGSGQGEREFQAEVEIISRVHHKHLVSLVGYCMTGAERLLVYEFVPNNTLEFHLHGKGRPTMEFPSRMRIALGSAKGLAYLHEDCNPKIIHRDIKAANILLDSNFEAKVADFGLAKITSELNTHVSTRVMGTFGYLAPEYASSGKLTDKSDVFSFGIMLLEMVTGRRPVDSAQTYMDDSLVDWARPLLTRALEEGNFDSLVDSRLQNNYNQSEMSRMVACAAACVRHSARRRPRMSQVVRALEGDLSLSDLNEGITPGHSTVYSSHESSDYDTMQYKEDMKKFRKMALASQEYASSEVSRPTSEYGLYLSGSSSEGQQTREMEMGKTQRDSRGYSGNSGF
ncbi:proline-rich receptor-like protein kinase PERK15 isoform X2 [Apium graveolens]|uniref:proline-rich receptor-like protein kinase PERK15 isoform X2 n=1 Tax=Apium graveolens TaxID=4045 RepID=UPI003D79EF05